MCSEYLIRKHSEYLRNSILTYTLKLKSVVRTKRQMRNQYTIPFRMLRNAKSFVRFRADIFEIVRINYFKLQL